MQYHNIFIMESLFLVIKWEIRSAVSGHTYVDQERHQRPVGYSSLDKHGSLQSYHRREIQEEIHN